MTWLVVEWVGGDVKSKRAGVKAADKRRKGGRLGMEGGGTRATLNRNSGVNSSH